MNKIEAVILGIIQGLTEFLPVSSSGHLELAKSLLGDQSVPEESLLFTVVVHFATALATVVIYRHEVIHLTKGLFRFKDNEEFKYSLKIVISMIPAAVIGLLFEDQIESLFNGNVLLVGFMLIVTGFLLFFANNAQPGKKEVTRKDAIIIGIAQAIAIMPGISRSGATISTSVLLKVDREHAARFSFLMVVPLIFGKIAKDIMGGALQVQSIEPVNLALAFVAAFITGLWACNWMIDIVKRFNLNFFALYCFVMGSIAIFSVFLASE
jgi:undecaprenyl-diphosphatase